MLSAFAGQAATPNAPTPRAHKDARRFRFAFQFLVHTAAFGKTSSQQYPESRQTGIVCRYRGPD
jgi:hypothetical protein